MQYLALFQSSYPCRYGKPVRRLSERARTAAAITALLEESGKKPRYHGLGDSEAFDHQHDLRRISVER
jgi:hypothetical protein